MSHGMYLAVIAQNKPRGAPFPGVPSKSRISRYSLSRAHDIPAGHVGSRGYTYQVCWWPLQDFERKGMTGDIHFSWASEVLQIKE